MRLLRMTAILLAFPLVTATGCGGGGGSSGQPEPPGDVQPPDPDVSVTTYRDTTLPGRLLVNSPSGTAAVFDVRTGERMLLPQSAESATDDRWTASADGDTLLRWNTAEWRDDIPVSFFEATSLATTQHDMLVPYKIMTPMQSADGRRVLTFWQPGIYDDKSLTVFDVDTARPIKQGSLLDSEVVVSRPAAWLPDGRYVYMVGAELYVSSPESEASQLIARLSLPSNNVLEGGSYVAGKSDIAVSSDGRKLAFTWYARRETSLEYFDTNIWVVNVDGTELRRVTTAPDPTSPLTFSYGSPTWSPDGQWLAGVLYMSGATSAPVYPDEPFLGSRVVGTTGCAASPVFVVPHDAEDVAVSWPSIDANYTVKVKSESGDGGQWLTSCSSIHWLP